MNMNSFLLLLIVILSVDTTAQSQQDVVLTSTLTDGLVAYGEEEVTFTCITRFSNILQWRSREYIGEDGYSIQIYNGTLGTDVRRSNAHATLVRAEVENGVLMLVSVLRIQVSTQYPTATIQCDNNGHGARESITFALQNVTLKSTLTDSLVAYGEEEVVFRCTTRFSNILQWSSREYIGEDGYNIQIYNGTLGTDVRRGNTHATLVRAEIENGVLVLVSELRIRVSTQHSTAAIQCDNNGHGARESITFSLQNVTLTSTLTEGLIAYGEQEVIFMCVTRFSNILQWSSREYIGGDGYNIQIYNGTLGTNVRRGNAHATLVRADIETGVLVLVSELRIRVSTQYPTATIQCDNNGHGARESIMFNSIDRPIPRLNSSLHERLFACPGEEIHFECATSGSQNLTWTSEIYLGPDSTLQFTYNSPVNVPIKAISNSESHYAMLMNKSMETGRVSLTAALHIIVLESIRDRSHSITCLNTDAGTSTTIAFHLAETCEGPSTTISSVSTESSVESGNNDNSKYDPPLEVVLPIVIIAATALVITIIVLTVVITIWKREGKSSRIHCIADQTQASQYEAGDPCHKQKTQEYVRAQSTSPLRSTLSSEHKSLPNSGSTTSSFLSGSVGSQESARVNHEEGLKGKDTAVTTRPGDGPMNCDNVV